MHIQSNIYCFNFTYLSDALLTLAFLHKIICECTKKINILSLCDNHVAYTVILFEMFILLHILFLKFNSRHYSTLLEEMVLFRTRNGSIPRFIYGTHYIEPFFCW